MLDNTPNQPSKFRTKNWFEINDDTRETYETNSQIKFKTSVLKSSLCDYSDAYILLSGTITVNTIEMNQLQLMLALLIIFLVTVVRLNLNKK